MGKIKNNSKQKILKKRDKRKDTLLEVLCSVLSCWLIAVGTCLILDAQFTIQIGIKSILWQTLFAVVAVFLLTRRWWISIIYFGVLVPVFFLAISLSGDIHGFFESFASFINWWSSSMPMDSKWYSEQGYYLVHTIMNVGVGILYFAVARITKRAWTVVVLAFVFIIVNYVEGYTGYNYLAIPFFVVGLFPLLAGDKFQKIKLPEFKNLFGVLGKKSLLVLVSTFVAVMISLLSIGVILSTKGSVRVRLCSDIVADIQTLTNTYTNEQTKQKVTLFDLGLVTNSAYVGGSLYEIEPFTLATTDSKRPLLVKMTTFSDFVDGNWSNEFDKSYRINGWWKDEQKQFLSTTLLDDKATKDRVESATTNIKVNITLAKDMNFLPVVGQVIGFEEKTPTKNPILFDKYGRLISYYGQQVGYEYTLDTLIYNTDDEDTQVLVNRIYMAAAAKEDPLMSSESDFYKLYTKKIGDLPKKLNKALENFEFSYENEYEKAATICKYFSKGNGYIYTDKPPEFEKEDGLINSLFETKKGHCMYYATAAVAMAREVGVPARLVAGYKTIESDDKTTQIIDASSPYAWMECYLPNIGWVPFDPSPREIKNPQNKPADNKQDAQMDFDVNVERDKNNQQVVGGTHLEWDEESGINLPLIILLGVLALLIIWLIVRTVISQRFYRLESVKKRYKSTAVQAAFYYRDVLRQYRCLGFRFIKGETISELTERVCEEVTHLQKEKILCGIAQIEENIYGDTELGEDKVEQIFVCRQTLENMLKDNKNFISYTFKRRTLLPILCFGLKKRKR